GIAGARAWRPDRAPVPVRRSRQPCGGAPAARRRAHPAAPARTRRPRARPAVAHVVACRPPFSRALPSAVPCGSRERTVPLMHVLLVAGARPNFMKVAPIASALARAGIAHSLVHTGQHYDPQMSDAFFADLGLGEPDFHLGVGSGTHADQTARVMQAFEPVLVHVRPDWLVVVGDVNSTLACALVAVKLKEALGVRIAHVEAGLRSHDWRMPEEVNRVLTDRLSDLLLLPSRDAFAN